MIGSGVDGYIDDAIIFDEALDEAAIQVAMDTPVYELATYYGQPVNDDPNTGDYPYAPNIVMVPGESFTYNYVLTDDPDPNVIEVTIIPDTTRLDLGEGAGVSKVLSFDTNNWDVPQPVTVTAVVEDPYPGDAVVSITHSLGGIDFEDPNYVTLTVPADLGIQLLEIAPELECGVWGYHALDFNEDCYVNLPDLAVFAAEWLVCTDPLGDGCIEP
jgi:hypothetical protein